MDASAAHHSSAAAFVEGGIQDACEDSCSICLEPFCDSNPITVTSCKHGYHLQCIIEWSQRSKDCPMCWQALSLKDPNSQELLDAVERERAAAWMPPILQSETADGIEFHHVPAISDDSDFEERIMQHLAAAARAHQLARRRERQSGVQDHPQLVVLPTHPSSPVSLVSGRVASGVDSSPFGAVGPPREQLQLGRQTDAATPRMIRRWSDPVRGSEMNRTGTHSERLDSEHNIGAEHAEESQQRSPGDGLSFSESLKSRFAAASSRYKETLTRTTRGFRERLRARNNAMTDLGARAREVSAGVVRALERISLESNAKNKEDSDIPTGSTSRSSPPITVASEPSSNSEGESGAEGSNVSSHHNETVPSSAPIQSTVSAI